MEIKDYSIFLSNNFEESLKKLEGLGFDICTCCRFKDAKWLHFYCRELTNGDRKLEFHGVGNGCENECDGMCSEKCVTCTIKESVKSRNTMIFSQVEPMVEFINQFQFVGNNDLALVSLTKEILIKNGFQSVWPFDIAGNIPQSYINSATGLTVHYSDGDFWCRVGDHITIAKTVGDFQEILKAVGLSNIAEHLEV